MKRNIILGILVCVLTLFAAPGCMKMKSDPYSGYINSLKVRALYPVGYESYIRAGVRVRAENINTGDIYNLYTDANGIAEVHVPNGLYRIIMSDRVDDCVFNALIDKVIIVGADEDLLLVLKYSRPGNLVIKEIYCGGCSKEPYEGNYQSDKYVIVHNNAPETAYLDGLCFSSLKPYNSNSSKIYWNPDGSLPDFVPVIPVILEFPGDGTSFPLEPGEDAVICLNGAIDHTLQYPGSVNLNNEDYFVCYNTTYFPNPAYHPAYGDKIREERIMDIPLNLEKSNAYTISMSSPAVVLFRPVGISIEDYVAAEGSVIQIPGKSDKVLKVPEEWVIDGVEVFNGSSSANEKRLIEKIDAGYISFSEIYKGRSLFRKTDEVATSANGFQTLLDTNNSTEDFYERESQSLRK